jgi:hypothetical protein
LPAIADGFFIDHAIRATTVRPKRESRQPEPHHRRPRIAIRKSFGASLGRAASAHPTVRLASGLSATSGLGSVPLDGNG